MPEISRFFGIVILLNFNDHAPPHFHAQSGGEEVLVSIKDLKVIRGNMSARNKRLVMKWAALHKDELLRAWDEAQLHHTPEKIEPLHRM
jgi:hypothetical protein